MSFSEDDEPKTPEKPKEDKQPFGINDKDMNQLIIIGAILIGLFLFKDEIMGMVNQLGSGLGNLGGGGQQQATEEAVPTEGTEGEMGGEEMAGMGGMGMGRKGGRGRGRWGKHMGRRHGKGAKYRWKRHLDARSNTYFGIANVNP